jgi:O-antigen/teichoic acid export membrane protein
MSQSKVINDCELSMIEPMTAKSLIFRRVASTSSWNLVLKIFGTVLAFLTQLALARFYGAELMGNFIICSNIAFVLGLLGSLGLDNGMLRFSALLKEQGQNDTVLRLLRRCSIALMLFAALLAGGVCASKSWLAYYFHSPALTVMLPLFMVSLIFLPANAMLRETLRGLGSVVWATAVQFVVQPAVLLLSLTVLYFMRSWGATGPQSLSLAFFLSVLFTAGLTAHLVTRVMSLLRKNFREHAPEGKAIDVPWSKLCRYSFPLLISASMLLVWGMLDHLILGLLRPPQEVAFYGVAYRFALVVSFPLIAINAVLPALFVQLYHRRELADLEHLASTCARWALYLSLPLCLFLILNSHELLAIFGPGFNEARWSMSLLAVGQLVCVVCGTPFYLLYMTERQNAALKVLSFGAGLSLPFMVLLGYLFGKTGVAIGSAGGWALIHLLGSLMVWRELKIKIYAQQILSLSVMSLSIFAIAWIVRIKLGAAWGAAFFILSYMILLWKVVVNNKEMELFGVTITGR